MVIQYNIGRYQDYTAWGKSGSIHDVDQLMHALTLHDDLATSKLVDYALSLVTTIAGIARIRHYLFNGVQIQRNFAALYFKRRGAIDLLDEAVADGKIDEQQAYAK